MSSKDKIITVLYQQYGRRLVARLRRVYGAGPPDADDLAQIAFEKLTQVEDISQIKSPEAFLFRVATNAGLDQLNRQSTQHKYEKELVQFTENVQNYTPETVYLDKEQIERISLLINELPEIERQLIYLSRFKGETLATIAKELGVSISFASRQLSKTLAKLQKSMHRYNMIGE